MTRVPRPFIVLSMLAVAPALSAASPSVRIGSIEVPAVCPLARGEHPRLLLTKGQLPGIRSRIPGTRLEKDLALLRRTIDEGLASGSRRARSATVPLGVLFHLTGERAYGEACRRAVVEHGQFGTYAALGLYGYDLVHDLLSPEERRACEEKSLAFLRRERWRPRARLMHAVAIHGSGTGDALVAEQLSELVPWLRARTEHLDGWARDRGGDGNSHGYIGQHEYVGTMGAIQAWRCASGEDLLRDLDWARLMPPYYVYHYPPGRRDTVHVGINCWGANGHPAETGACNFTSLAQAEFRDGLARWWIEERIVGRRHDYEVFGTLWGPLLWLDPTVEPVRPEDLPPTMLFRERGYLSMRSDWSEDAVYAHFHCGRFESDSRNNADNNSFIIYRRGYLACDTGTRGLNNPEQRDMSDGRHHDRYFPQTVAHNSITVGTDDIEGNGWTAVCGGQVSRPRREWLERLGIPITSRTLYEPRAGEVIAFETCPELDYVAGDATRSYSPDRVERFTRQLVFIRPDLFVVFDRVTSVRAGDPKRWYLHTMEEPRLLDGEETPDPSVHPEGHFLWDGRSGRAEHEGSALLFRTLLPEDATIRKIGGPGHQFEVNGENLDMYDAWYDRLGPSFAKRIGLGLWRIEVEPARASREDTFLHVLRATDAAAPGRLEAERLMTEEGPGARIRTPDGEVTVTFARRGSVGGHITIRRGAETVVDRPLARTVEDHYEAWRADPRYPRWHTAPFRAALTPVAGRRSAPSLPER